MQTLSFHERMNSIKMLEKLDIFWLYIFHIFHCPPSPFPHTWEAQAKLNNTMPTGPHCLFLSHADSRVSATLYKQKNG